MARQRYCRRLARIGKPCASLPTASPSQPPTPARKAGVLDPRTRIGPSDCLTARGRWLQTLGPRVMNGDLGRQVPALIAVFELACGAMALHIKCALYRPSQLCAIRYFAKISA